MSTLPGRGGIGRGGVAAEMIWGEETESRSAEFQARALDPAQYLDAQSTAVLDINQTAPEVAPEHEGAGLIEVEASAGGSAWRRRIAPRHRGAVKAFFGSSTVPVERDPTESQIDPGHDEGGH